MDEQLIKAALTKFGTSAQITKAIEEMGELIVELSKYLLQGGNDWKVCEELADVSIMMEQLTYWFGRQWVENNRAEKLIRLEVLTQMNEATHGDDK